MSTSPDWITFRAPAAGEDARAGTVVGTIPCHCCGRPTVVKLNKNLIAYSYCNAAGNEDPCGSGYKWSRKASDAIRRTFATTTTTTKDTADHAPEADAEDRREDQHAAAGSAGRDAGRGAGRYEGTGLGF